MLCQRGTQKRDFGYRLLQMVAVVLTTGLALTGCRKQIAPHPPSLDLPGPVGNVAAIRAGDQVSLSWTMPERTTQKREIKGNITVRVCRRDSMVGVCIDAGEPFVSAPGALGSFSETLPAPLASGAARALYYFLELKNSSGRSAGLFNAVATLAGAPPSLPIEGLTAQMDNDGVLFRWIPPQPEEERNGTVIRLYKSLVTPGLSEEKQRGITHSSKRVEQDLVLDAAAASGCALAKHLRDRGSYEYRAQRVARVNVNGQTLELAGFLSAPVRIGTVNVDASFMGPSKSKCSSISTR